MTDLDSALVQRLMTLGGGTAQGVLRVDAEEVAKDRSLGVTVAEVQAAQAALAEKLGASIEIVERLLPRVKKHLDDTTSRSGALDVGGRSFVGHRAMLEGALPSRSNLRFAPELAWLDPAQHRKLKEVAPSLVELMKQVSEVLGERQLEIVTGELRGAAAMFTPPKTVTLKPMAEVDQTRTLDGLSASDHLISLAHELQHVLDAYKPGDFALSEAVLSPGKDVFKQLLHAEWLAHARQAKVAFELQEQGRPVPLRHRDFIAEWDERSFDVSRADHPQSMFALTRAYISRYKYDNRKQATDEETAKLIAEHPQWIREAFEICPPRRS